MPWTQQQGGNCEKPSARDTPGGMERGLGVVRECTTVPTNGLRGLYLCDAYAPHRSGAAAPAAARRTTYTQHVQALCLPAPRPTHKMRLKRRKDQHRATQVVYYHQQHRQRQQPAVVMGDRVCDHMRMPHCTSRAVHLCSVCGSAH